MRSSVFVTFAGLVLAGISAAPAHAGNWELEIHGGGMLTNAPSGGESRLPPAGATFDLFGDFTSRYVPSWYFGDGAALFNDGKPGFHSALVPLDPVLTGAAAGRPNGGAVGLRLTRRINARFAAELSLDYNLARFELTDASVARIESTRASLPVAWNQVLGTHDNLAISSNAAVLRNGDRQVLASGALNIRLRRQGPTIPFLTIGLGIASNGSRAVGADLTGDMGFGLRPAPFERPPIARFHETDNVKFSSSIPKTSWFGLLGAGLKHDLSARWGLRADVRGHLGRHRATTRLDAEPRAEHSSPWAISSYARVPPGTGFRWVNFDHPEFRSSLSTSVRDFETYKGSGAALQMTATVGLYLRY
jgi:hypothetical protein